MVIVEGSMLFVVVRNVALLVAIVDGCLAALKMKS